MVKRATGLTDYWFDPTRLTAAIKNANVASFKVAHEDARVRRHNKSKSDVSLKVLDTEHAQLIPRGLQATFEKGRIPGYPIFPGGAEGLRKAKRQGVFTYVVKGSGTYGGNALALAGPELLHPLLSASGGKMGKYPAMQPAAVDWARKGYSTVSRRVLAAQGHGVGIR